MIKTILWLSAIAAIPSSALAQEPQDAPPSKKPSEEKPAYAVSFVVVGARSDAYWVGDGPDMKVMAHDPGAAPPKDIFIAVPKEKGAGGSSKSSRKRLMLALNVPTDRVKLRSNVCSLTARYQSGEDVGYKNFTSALLPKKLNPYTVFLARQPKHKTWKSPQRMVLPDSKTRFPLGAARVVNLSDRPVVIQRGKKVVGTLKPGKSATLKKVLRLKNPETLMILYEDKGKKRVAFRRALNYPNDQRVNIACTYVPKRSKSLLSHLFVTTEPPKPPAPPKKKSGVTQSGQAQ